VEQLERGRHRDDAVETGRGVGRRIEVVALGGDRLPPPVAEERAEPLAAGEQGSGRRIDDIEVGGDLIELCAAIGEVRVEPELDEIH
jgi:hypothetical protein